MKLELRRETLNEGLDKNVCSAVLGAGRLHVNGARRRGARTCPRLRAGWKFASRWVPQLQFADVFTQYLKENTILLSTRQIWQ